MGIKGKPAFQSDAGRSDRGVLRTRFREPVSSAYFLIGLEILPAVDRAYRSPAIVQDFRSPAAGGRILVWGLHPHR